jgi:hypothetical protein
MFFVLLIITYPKLMEMGKKKTSNQKQKMDKREILDKRGTKRLDI